MQGECISGHMVFRHGLGSRSSMVLVVTAGRDIIPPCWDDEIDERLLDVDAGRSKPLLMLTRD